MKAMILAAGRGERMQPLTLTTPKPLLTIDNKPLIVYHIENLAAAGFKELVINVSYLGDQIVNALGNGEKWNVHINYSIEDEPQEVAGGICRALPLLGDEPFLTINADIWTDYPLANLKNYPVENAHLVLAPAPSYYPQGDFSLQNQTLIPVKIGNELIVTGVTVYHPRFFSHIKPGIQRMGTLWHQAVARGELTGECYNGKWHDIGTPERFYQINTQIQLLNQQPLNI